MNDERRIGLATYAAFVALSAYGGAAGLATGALDLGPTINERLPLHSPVLGAIALSAIVGLPATALASRAARGDRRTGAIARLAGAMIIGWIVIELAFIREISWLQPFYIAVGASFIVIGRRTKVPSQGVLGH